MKITYSNPSSMAQHPGLSQCVLLEGSESRTLMIGGQNAVNIRGEVVGGDDIKVQAEQVYKNLCICLEENGFSFDDVVSWKATVPKDANAELAYQVLMPKIAARKTRPPIISYARVVALSNPDWLLEIEAVAIQEK